MIFVTHPDPDACASILSDDHILTQMGEVASALSHVLSDRGVTSPFSNEGSRNAELIEWVSADWSHFMRLAFYGMALIEECDRRFGTLDRSASQIIFAGSVGYMLSEGDIQPPGWWPAPEVEHGSVFAFYRNALRSEYRDRDCMPCWTKTHPPRWLAGTGLPSR